MTTHFSLAMLSAVALFGCGMHTGNGTLIGATCTQSTECGPGGVCITSGPDGSCAEPCDVPGGIGQCLIGAYCDREQLQSDLQGKTDMTLCLPSCTSASECRSGYACKDISSGPGKVCKPK